jgi:choline monooxygenase
MNQISPEPILASDSILAGQAEIRAALESPLEAAEGLPGHYYGAEFYKIEQRRLFPSTWAAIAVGAQIPNPGDVLPVDLAGWPLLLVRQNDGEVSAFHNICRHRAIRLIAKPCGNQKSLRCSWHSWRYGLDGKLLATPEIGGARMGEASGFDKAELGLKPIRVGRWLDFIFVNIDGAAPPFDAHIAPLDALLSGYDFSDIRRADAFEDSYNGNWKIVTESGIEDYHLPFGHPQLNAHLLRNSTPFIVHPVYTALATDLTGFPAEAEQRAWNARLPDLPRRDESGPRMLYAINVFPTGSILLAADHVMLGIHLPEGPERTRVDINIYAHGDAATSADYADARQGTLDMWTEVLPQDAAFIEGVQATIHVRDAAGIKTRFSPYWEAGVRSFQKMVLDAVT